jgi:chaperonin GroEL
MASIEEMKWEHIPGAPGFRPTAPKIVRRQPSVVLQPRVSTELQKGINLMANAVRPTLGPRPRLVALERLLRTEAAEILDDGATIVRRVTEIKPRAMNTGAMLFRQAMWRMHVDAGDGTTTMAVLYQTIFNEGLRYVTQFGSNAMLLRAGLEAGLTAILAALDQAATPIVDRDQIAIMARGMCQEDLEMANMLGEIFDIVGPDGLIIVEPGHRHEIEREYIDGTYWHLSGWLSRHFITVPKEKKAIFEDAALLISDLTITEPQQLVPALDKCVKAGVKKLIVLCRDMSDSAIGLLVTNNQAKTIESMAVRTPEVRGPVQVAAMEDIAVLTGGRAFYADGKESFENFKVEDLGHARRAWAMESLFGIFGGKGDPRQVRQHISYIRGMQRDAEPKNERKVLQQRLGRLTGATALLKVGGVTATEIEVRKEMAERAVMGIRKALQGGVVAGGGAALVNAQAALHDLPCPHEEYAVAYKILASALEEPMRTIAKNAGAKPDVLVEKVKDGPPGYGVDARTRQIVEMRPAGILDSVVVLKKALEIAVSGAAMALTTDVIVHHKKPQISIEP